MSIDPKPVAESALEHMQAAGFHDSHVSVSMSEQDELNIAHNEASLLRSTENYEIVLVGIVDGRKASATLTDIADSAIAEVARGLFERVHSSPQDDANAVSADQVGHFEQGPMDSDLDLLAEKTNELLDYRARNAPKVMIEEGGATHRMARTHEVTSLGTSLSCTVGYFDLSLMCTASDAGKVSSFNFSGGRANDLRERHAAEFFALGEMLVDTQNQIDTQPIGSRFTGAVILAPSAVSDLVGWLLQQLGSQALIADSSVYKDRVGEQVAATSLSLRSHFDAPGHAPYTVDGFKAEPILLLDNGRLTTLLPDLYGSRKTGLSHTPSTSGWRIDPGSESRADLLASVKQGALVNRLSMGAPAASGDFSGVIKNSFMIEGGKVGAPLAETMIAGNMARMLKDISGISAEHIDYGGEDFPWLRIPGMHFS
jgi:PmbA protein